MSKIGVVIGYGCMGLDFGKPVIRVPRHGV